jgi:hypothetical protein
LEKEKEKGGGASATPMASLGVATHRPASLGWPNPPAGQTGVVELPRRLLGVVSTTPILLFGGGQTTPKPAMGVAQSPLIFFLFSKSFFFKSFFFLCFFLKKNYF